MKSSALFLLALERSRASMASPSASAPIVPTAAIHSATLPSCMARTYRRRPTRRRYTPTGLLRCQCRDGPTLSSSMSTPYRSWAPLALAHRTQCRCRASIQRFNRKTRGSYGRMPCSRRTPAILHLSPVRVSRTAQHPSPTMPSGEQTLRLYSRCRSAACVRHSLRTLRATW